MILKTIQKDTDEPAPPDPKVTARTELVLKRDALCQYCGSAPATDVFVDHFHRALGVEGAPFWAVRGCCAPCRDRWTR